LWSPFQRHLGRMFGYAVIVENGLSLIAIGSMTTNGFHIFTGLFFARFVSFGMWALSLSTIKDQLGSLEVSRVLGIGKNGTLLIIGVLVAQFSIGGLPILAGFPLRVALLEEISLQSNVASWAIIIGLAGIWAASFYSISIFLKSEKGWGNFFSHSIPVNILLVLGVIALIFIGLFPETYLTIMEKILLAYAHLL